MALDCVKVFLFVVVCISFESVLCLKKEDCEDAFRIGEPSSVTDDGSPIQNACDYKQSICFTVIEKFSATLTSEMKEDKARIEEEFRKYCKNAKGKDNNFCYYLGGLETSATGILSEMSRPLQVGMPPDVVCRKLQKLDGQICDLRYEKTIDFKTVDLKKLKVRDLKKILADWDEDCEGCLEKTDYVKRINELKPKYVRDEL